MAAALRTGNGLAGTVEFFPEEQVITVIIPGESMLPEQMSTNLSTNGAFRALITLS